MAGVPTRGLRARLAACWVALVLAAGAAPAAGADSVEATAPPDTPKPTATAATPLPLPDVANRGAELTAYLQEVERRLDPGATVRAVNEQLPELAERLRLLQEQTTRVVAARPALRKLDELSEQWEGLQNTLAEAEDTISSRLTQLEQEMAGLVELRAIWKATGEMAKQAGAPGEMQERIRSNLTLIQALRKQINAYRQALLVLQDRIVQQRALARAALDQLQNQRRDAIGRLLVRERLLVRDGLPIWARARWAGTSAEAQATLDAQAAATSAVLSDFVPAQLPRVPFQILLFVALVVLWRRARAHTIGWLAEDRSLANLAAVFEHPFSAALLLTLISSVWIHPQAPFQVRTLLRLIAVLPLLRVVDRLVAEPLRPAMYMLASFFVVDQVRAFFAGVPQVEQTLFLLEMAAGVLGAVWMLRSGRIHRLSGHVPARTVTFVERGMFALAVLFAIAALANMLGFVQLGRFIASAVLDTGYAALGLFTLERLLAGVWAFALRTPLLRRLRAVQRHSMLLQVRGERALEWIAHIVWIIAALRAAELLNPLLAAVRAALGAHLRVGTFSMSLGDLLAFGLTFWAAVLLSRFARFVLEEDIYPHLHLARGLPYAISNVLHYVILLVGFFIALAATGLDLDRFAILAGAFGVGVGFGMQSIIHNFVSGLILLFERPIQVGDVVQIGELSGEVLHIGIRASTVRTAEGAEVIVPNGNLIAAPVTNWTLSDRMRRIDLAVAVAYGSDPERVLDLLRGVAGGNPRILERPEPVALFVGFGDNRLDFQLRAWTDRFEDWAVIRSELAIAVNRALVESGITMPRRATTD
jgi:small-conductance mechanosensitive channel